MFQNLISGLVIYFLNIIKNQLLLNTNVLIVYSKVLYKMHMI